MLGLGFALVECDLVYLVDCDNDALEMARENVVMLEEEGLISRRRGEGDVDAEDEDADDGSSNGCLGIELIVAKVNYVPPKRRNNNGGSGGGRGGHHQHHRGGRGRKGNTAAPRVSHPPNDSNCCHSQNNELLSDDNNNDDGIPIQSKIVDTVITNPPFGTKNNEGIDVQFLKTAIRLARHAVYSFHKTSTRSYMIKLIRESWGLNVEVVAQMKFDIPNMYKFHKQKSVDVDVDLIRIYWKKTEIEEDDDGDLDKVVTEEDGDE
jgi:predicted RNA methylase